jgi:hypothetical protein
MQKIIMISAKQGGGKTAITDELLRPYRERQEAAKAAIKAKLKNPPDGFKSQLPFNFVGVHKFAKELYALSHVVQNRMETLTGQPPVEKDGELLQLLGNWARKRYGADVWVNTLIAEIKKYESLDADVQLVRGVFIDDCRFENEFNAFPQALRIRLECPEDVRKARAPVWRPDVNHPSEIGLDRYAAEGRFDLYFNTDPANPGYLNVAGVCSLITAQLQKNNWIEKRRVYHD